MLANPTEAALSTELAEAVGRARDFARASKANATRKAYASDLRDFAATMMNATATADDDYDDEEDDEEEDDARLDMLAELEALEELGRPRPAIREHHYAERGA